MNIVLFDEPFTKKNLLPFTFTRPVSELRIGILTIKEKWEKYLSIPCSYFTESYLSDKYPAEIGKQKWQKESDYNYRSLVETAMYRYKMIISNKVYSKKIINQNVESKIGCYILNKMVELGMPISLKKAV